MSGVRQSFSKKFNREAMFGDEKVNALFDMTRFVVTEENKNEPGAAGKALGQRVHDDGRDMMLPAAVLVDLHLQALADRMTGIVRLADVPAGLPQDADYDPLLEFAHAAS